MPKKRKMEIITPTKKVEDAVKCGSTLQAYTIFKSILDYEEYELKGQEQIGRASCRERVSSPV